jgi:hypothetical protein
MFGSAEKKAEKEHQRALKAIRWAFKATGVTEADLQIFMTGGEDHILLLTMEEMISVKKGAFGGGKEQGRVRRDQVRGVRRETGWNDGFVFTIEGASLPKGNKFPYGGDSMFENTFNFFDALSGGRLVEWMTEEEQSEPFTFMRELSLEFPGAETGQQPPAGPTVPTAPPEDIPEMIRKLGELKEAGLLTEAEFEAKKSKLLTRM